jgi:hypothetical protein
MVKKNAITGILCLFSGMNKLLLQALFCFWCFSACRQGGSRQSVRVQESSKEDGKGSSQKEGITDLDTSMVSLKTFKAVALTDVISQVWKFEDADKSHWNELFWDSVTDKRQYPELAFFPDHFVTANARCRLQMGQWRLNKDTRELGLQFKGSSQTYIIREIAVKQMELAWNKTDGPVSIKLSAQAIVHKRPLDDPFYPANNQWRIKPAAPETREQLRLRVKNCVHFYSLFFLDNHFRQETDISFIGLPSCFVWYNGGIGMQAKPELDKKWIDCFYSSNQAYTGYELVESILGQHVLKWPEHPTSWVKQTGEVLGQLAAKL